MARTIRPEANMVSMDEARKAVALATAAYTARIDELTAEVAALEDTIRELRADAALREQTAEDEGDMLDTLADAFAFGHLDRAADVLTHHLLLPRHSIAITAA